MKVLKCLCCLALSVTVCTFPAVQTASASDGRQYARADNRNVYFCADTDDGSARFAVPYTYCVEILADKGDWYLVRYAEDDGFYISQTGYCRKDGLTLLDDTPQNPYLSYPVTATLRANVPDDGSLPGLEITVEAAYYGVYYKGAAAYSCVLYDEKFWYVPGANDGYPLNEIPAQPAFSPTEPQDGGGNARLITAVLIVAVAATVVAVLLITGRQASKGRREKL